MDVRKPKLREYTEYFAKNQALPGTTTLVAGNGTLELAKGVSQNALNLTLCAKGSGVTVKEVSVQVLASPERDGAYAAVGTLFKKTFDTATPFRDGEVIASFPLYDDTANNEIPYWIKASFGGGAGNTGNFDSFIEYMPR